MGEETAPTHLERLKPEGSSVKIYLDFDNSFLVLHPVVYLGPDVYRIGQKKCVQIIYLIAKGTIEEKINDVKQQKQALIEKLISPGEELLTTLSAQELRQLLS